MTEISFKGARCERRADGLWLCLNVEKDNQMKSKRFAYSVKDKPYVAQIKEKRNHRSLDANAYCWALIVQMADILGVGKEEVYQQMLKQYGQGGEVTLSWNQVNAFTRAWRYNEPVQMLGEGENARYVYRFWIGSSAYDTKEMAALIDGVVSECKDLGIDTRTPDEIRSMMALWDEKQKSEGNGHSAVGQTGSMGA